MYNLCFATDIVHVDSFDDFYDNNVNVKIES